MKLSFECNQDPRKMPTRQGKKFCKHCNKHVYDLRRKSDEKIRQFYDTNPSACIIAYQDQLNKLPARRKKEYTRSYFPYAAAVIAVSLLPTLSRAQKAQTVQAPPTSPIPTIIPELKTPVTENSVPAVTQNTTGYKLIGKITFDNNDYKLRKPAPIFVYKTTRDITQTHLTDSIASGKVNTDGTFSLKISERYFNELKQTDHEQVWIYVEGPENYWIKSITFAGNMAILEIIAETRIMVRGAY